MSHRILSVKCSSAFFVLVIIAVAPAIGQERGPSAEQIARCWQELAADDAEMAYRSAARLMNHPAPAVKLLRERLKAVEAPDLKQIRAWIDDLASSTFPVRDKASNALMAQAELAEQPLRKALESKLPLETRRRIQNILNKLDQPVAAPDKLRQIRAIEVLETLGNADARDLLQALAKGYPEHRQTRQAQEALARLKERAPMPDRWFAWLKNRQPAPNKDEPLPFGARTRLGTTRYRHDGHGRPGAFTADGRLVISHDENAIYLWETQTGKLERRFDIAAACLAVAPKESLLAFGLTGRGQIGGAVVYWNWQTGKELRRLDLPPGVSPRRLAFSADGGKVYCQCTDENLRQWDIQSGQESSLWQPEGLLRKLHGVSPDGALIMVGSRDGHYVLDLKKNQKHVLPPLDREPRQVLFSPDSSLLAIATDHDENRLHVCDVATGKLLWRAGNGIGAYVYSVGFTADSKILAVGSYRQQIALWDVRTGKFLRTLAGSHDGNIGVISRDGRWLASTGQTLRIWNMETGERISPVEGHSSALNGASLSPRFDWIATFDHREVHLWDPLTGEHKRRLETGGTFVRGVAVSPDGKLVAVAQPGPGEGFVKVWEASTGRLVYKLAGHGVRHFGSLADVRFSRDGQFLLSWGDDFYLRKWDMKTGKALLEYATRPPGIDVDDDRFGFQQVHHGWTSQLDRFLMLDPTGDLHSMNINTGAKGPVVKLRPIDFGPCAYSPTAKLVAAVSRGFDVTVHDATSGKLVLNVALPARARRLAFAPDERTLAVVAGGKIVVYELASEKTRLTFNAKAEALTFSSDGRFLAAAMSDTTALIWDLALLADTAKK